MCVNKIEAMYEKLSVNIKVEGENSCTHFAAIENAN